MGVLAPAEVCLSHTHLWAAFLQVFRTAHLQSVWVAALLVNQLFMVLKNCAEVVDWFYSIKEKVLILLFSQIFC